MDGTPKTWHGKKRVASWNYKDKKGKNLGIVSRYEDDASRKDVIPFFKANGTRFHAGAPAEPRPLYGLELLVPLGGKERVFVPEGEKCTRALHSLGLPAVTSLGGSNAAAKADWLPISSSREIYLLPDNNKSGKRYIEDVAQQIKTLGKSPNLFIVRLSGLPVGGDVVDWLQARLIDWDGYQDIPERARENLRDEFQRVVKESSEPYRNLQLPTTIELSPNPLAGQSKFPLDKLPTPLIDAVKEISRFDKVPVESPATIVLSMIATAIGKKAVVVERPGLELYPSLFFALIAGSGERKTPVFKHLQSPFITYAIDMAEEYERKKKAITARNQVVEARIKKILRSAEKAQSRERRDELAKEIADLRAELEPLPSDTRRFTSDFTEQILFRRMHEHGGEYAVQSSEGRPVFDSILGKYSGEKQTGDAIILAGISGDTITRDRIGNPESGGEESAVINSPCLNVCAMVQPDKYLQIARHPNLRQSGAIARIFATWLPSMVGQRIEKKGEDGLKDGKLMAYNQLIGSLLDAKRFKPHKAFLSKEAAEMRRLFHNKIESMMGEDGDLADVRDIASKATSQTVKIALVLHVAADIDIINNDSSEISAETWIAASQIGSYYLEQSVAVQRFADEDHRLEPARRILNWMKQKNASGKATFSFAEILQLSPRPRLSAKDLNSIMGVLVDSGNVKEMQGSGRRPDYCLDNLGSNN